MKYQILLFFSIFTISLFFTACTNEKPNNNVVQGTKWENLIDTELSLWDSYLSFKHSIDYDGTPPLDSLNKEIPAIGINKPGYNVFSIIKENNEPVLRVSGEYYGCIATKKEYENYHFQLQFKWGDKKWLPRINKMKDSGILYHSIGNFGAEYWRTWMMSQEFQIMESHTGDFWNQATSAIDIRAFAPESGLNPMANKNQDFLSFGEQGEAGKYCLRSNNYENPHGSWNTLDLYCFGDKSLHIVNGQVVMILKNSRYLNENQTFVPLTKGKIQIQSEAAEVFFKNIKIRSIDLFEEFTAYYETTKN